METLPEVETARALMTEAMAWSVVRWLREKKRVRKTADQANAALDQLSNSIQERWPGRIKNAYAALIAQCTKTQSAARGNKPAMTDSEAVLIASKLRKSDEEARQARMDAEESFDKAERLLSTSLARGGCRKAIYSWDLHEKAIRKAEAVIVK